MRVWLLHIGEDLPVDGSVRLYRYSFLAQAFADRGHEVLRWAPTFRHATKKHRYSSHRRVSIRDNYAIQFVHAPGYRHNVSAARLHSYRVLGQRFHKLAANEPAPDLIVAAIPSLEWANAAVDMGRQVGAKVVIDVRDLWPDVFANAVPAALRPFGQIALAPLRRLARRACRAADSLIAVSPSYLNWAQRHAGRESRAGDQVVPLGFEPEPITAATRNQILDTYRSRGITSEHPICLFAGLFERSSDLETVIGAAHRLAASRFRDTQFVLCGDGSKFAALRRRASALRNVHFTGWIDAPTLQSLQSAAAIGLCSYAKDAPQSLPNKPYEYMATGMAIVSSLRGDMEQILQQHECGVTYAAGNAADLANSITQLLAAPSRLQSMRSKAHAAWAHQYRSRDVYARFVDNLIAVPEAAAQAA